MELLVDLAPMMMENSMIFLVSGFSGDTVTIGNMEAYLAYVRKDTMLWYNLGWTGADEPFSMPILGGTGNIVDPVNTYEVDPFTGELTPSGTVIANHGYLFDPAGSDGVPFNGDEALAPTGYFFTYNYGQLEHLLPY